MSIIRDKAVSDARSTGICTSCLKNPATQLHYQCQRCLDTNTRKKDKRRIHMATKPKGMSQEEFNKVERDRKRVRREKNAQYARELYHRKQAAKGLTVKSKTPMSQEHKDRIRKGVALATARREAFGKKDTGVRGTYKKKVPIASIQMSGMINDLERFIAGLDNMTARDYLEARTELILSIIKRGAKVEI